MTWLQTDKSALAARIKARMCSGVGFGASSVRFKGGFCSSRVRFYGFGFVRFAK